MSDDLIKRSDALSAAGDMSYIAFEIRRKIRMIPSIGSMTVTTEEAIEHLQECGWLPEHDRILTEPTCGKWEEKETFSVADDDPIIEQWQSARCSECGKYHTTPYVYYFNDYNYCPYCGARMRGADDEAD